VGTALLVLAGLSLVIIMFGTGTFMARMYHFDSDPYRVFHKVPTEAE
jgi:hypothetical protein